MHICPQKWKNNQDIVIFRVHKNKLIYKQNRKRRHLTFFEHPPSMIRTVLTRFRTLSSCHLSLIKMEYKKLYLTCKSSVVELLPEIAFITLIAKGMFFSNSFQTLSNVNSLRFSYLCPYSTEPSERRQSFWQAELNSSLIRIFSSESIFGQCCLMIPATEDGDIELTALTIWSTSITSSCTGRLVTSSSKFIGEGLDEESSFIGCSRLPWLFCVGFSSNISCFAEDCFLHTSVAARFDGCLEDGDNSVQRFTEHFCSSSSTI